MIIPLNVATDGFINRTLLSVMTHGWLRVTGVSVAVRAVCRLGFVITRRVRRVLTY